MFKKRLSLFGILLLSLGFLFLQADVSLDFKLRFYEGLRTGTSEPLRSVTSSYLQPTVTASIESKYLPGEEQDQIKKVFSLKDVRLITEADLRWSSRDSDKIFHIFRLDGKEYLFMITPVSPVKKRQFRIEVFEQSEEKKSSLLDTEIILPEDNIAVFGFEDLQSKPYFVSFHAARSVIGGVVGGVLGGVKSGVEGGITGGVEGGVEGGVVGGVTREETETPNVVRAAGEIKPPKLLEKVDPVYPEEARKERVEGVVILEATTDKGGKVVKTRVLRSVDPLLDNAAVEAVEQWKYAPAVIGGKPTGIIFTVTCRFKLKDVKTEEFDMGAMIAGEDKEIKPPKLIKKVDPVYPEEAREARIQGVVVLRVWVNEEGSVEKTMTMKSDSSILNEPAIEAVRQWKYEPLFREEKPTPVVFNVTISFKLK